MAFGDVRGTKTGTATSITASFACATGTNFAVSVGDVIVSTLAEQAAMTVTACTDNLSNTYTALGAGSDAGTVTGRGFYTRVTNAGTISSVTFTATASSNNCVGLAAGFEGPFAVSPLDASPTAVINDNTTPYTCPPTGTLAQADEKIVNVIVHNGNPTLTATSPNLKAIELNSASVLKAAIGHQTVASTASVTPAWTSSATPTASGYGTASFKKAAGTFNEGAGDADGVGAATAVGGAITAAGGAGVGTGAATAQGSSIFTATSSVASGVGAATATGTGIKLATASVANGVGVATASGVAISYLRPDGDTATDGWTDQADGTTNIYQSVDEISVSDSDFVQSPSVAAADLTVRLFDGSTQVAEWIHTDVSETFATAEQTLTTPQFEAITNFANLFVELDDTQGNVYRFPVSNPTTGVGSVKLRYRYKKLAA